MNNTWDWEFLDNLACSGDTWMRSFIQQELHETEECLGICDLKGHRSLAPLFALYAYGLQHPYTTQGVNAAKFLFGQRDKDFRKIWNLWRDQDYERAWLPFINWMVSLEDGFVPSGSFADSLAMDRKTCTHLIQLKSTILCLDACSISLPTSVMERCGVLLTRGWDYSLHVQDTTMRVLLQRIDPMETGPWKILMPPNV